MHPKNKYNAAVHNYTQGSTCMEYSKKGEYVYIQVKKWKLHSW